MAIKLVHGKIGSGKTYFCVHHILDNYAAWDDVKDCYVLKEGIVLFSNIDGFTLAGDLFVEMEKAGGINPFFTVEYQKAFCKDKKVIYLIDEAQGPRFFHRKFYDKEVFYFFQYSRHLGIDIYLVCQDINSLVREVRELPEYLIQPARRTKSLTGEFRYNFHYDDKDNEVFKRKILSRKKAVFALYKSMESEEVEKLPSSPRRFILVFACFIIAAVLGFKFMFTRLFMPSTAEAKKLEVKKPYDVANNHHLINPDNADKKTRSLTPLKNVVRQGHFVKLVNDERSGPVRTAKKSDSQEKKKPALPKKVELLENYGCNENECYTIRDGKITVIGTNEISSF